MISECLCQVSIGQQGHTERGRDSGRGKDNGKMDDDNNGANRG